MDSAKNQLKRLKQKVFGRAPKEKDAVLTFVNVMEKVGGYEALLKLPIPAYQAIVESLNYKAELEKKAASKSRRRK